MSSDEAHHGAQRLAAAVTMQKKPAIRVPDGMPISAYVDGEAVLKDWDARKCGTLLSRSIFDPAIYGSVRFHHRSVREYLTAEWLFDLLKKGKSRRHIEQLFFSNRYGKSVVIPTMRPILPWLALLDEGIRSKTLHLASEVLFEGGDPGSLPRAVRADILTRICERLAVDEVYRTELDYSAIRRFAAVDIESTVHGLLVLYQSHNDVCSLLLGMAWHAKLPSCAEIATKIATTLSAEKYRLVWAIRVVGAVGDPAAIRQCINFLLKNAGALSREAVAEAIKSFSSKGLEISDLVVILTTVDLPDKYQYTSLSSRLEKFIQTLSEKELVDFVIGLRPYIETSPFKEPEYYRISLRYGWLLKSAALAVFRLVEARHSDVLSTDCLRIISLSGAATHYSSDSRKFPPFQPLVRGYAALNRALFWHDVALTRTAKQAKSERLTDWWPARFPNDYWAFSVSDFDYVTEQIAAQFDDDDKLVALSLAIHLYFGNGRGQNWRKRLEEQTKPFPEVCNKLQEFLIPKPPTEDEKKWRKQERQFKRARAERDRKEKASLEKWKAWLSSNQSVLRDVSIAKNGSVWNAQHYLHDRMREFAPNISRWGSNAWRKLEEVYGQQTAKAYRDGLVAYWREYQPKLRSDGLKNPNSIPHAIPIGLSGLEIEASELEDWPSNLTRSEARTASRFAMLEMNGFPSWIGKLHLRFPEIVIATLLKEIAWEVEEQGSEKEHSYVLADLVWHGTQFDEELAPLILKELDGPIPKFQSTLEHALLIVLRSKGVSDTEIATMAKRQLQKSMAQEHLATWCAALISVDPRAGIDCMNKLLDAISTQREQDQFCMQVAVHLTSERRSTISARNRFKQPQFLEKLHGILHRYIRVGES